MKNWKKLLLCIVISVLVSTFIGATLSVIKNRVIVYLFTKEELFSADNSYAKSFIDKVVESNELEKIENIDTQEGQNQIEQVEDKYKNVNINLNGVEEEIKRVKIENMSAMYMVTAGLENELYIFNIAIGIVAGILIYLIFIKKTKAKKIIIISLICFAIVFLGLNLGRIITDISTSTFELSDYIFNNDIIDAFFAVYIIILVILFIVNFIYQKRITKKLNKELNKELEENK